MRVSEATGYLVRAPITSFATNLVFSQRMFPCIINLTGVVWEMSVALKYKLNMILRLKVIYYYVT